MDFPRFYSLLSSSNLFFPSAYVLHKLDPFEGSLPRKEYELMLRKMDHDSLARTHDHLRKHMFISCWHVNDTESLAMWQLYSQKGSGIAVKTALADFKEAFRNTEEDVFVGKVIYVDYESEVFYQGEADPYLAMNAFEYFVHKRDIYRHEQELRAVAMDQDAAKSDLPGKQIAVDLNHLIKHVIVAPETPKWTLDMVNSLLSDRFPKVIAKFSAFHHEPLV